MVTRAVEAGGGTCDPFGQGSHQCPFRKSFYNLSVIGEKVGETLWTPIP
jgi:hypothetical protein